MDNYNSEKVNAHLGSARLEMYDATTVEDCQKAQAHALISIAHSLTDINERMMAKEKRDLNAQEDLLSVLRAIASNLSR